MVKKARSSKKQKGVEAPNALARPHRDIVKLMYFRHFSSHGVA
jgi:hypothetical protein